jgi:aminoglycoside phosphotransferase (APT) family kinase protein
MVLDWIEGQDMEAALQGLSSSAQYQLGYEAGRILKLIHGVEVEYEPFSWEDKFNEKIDRKIRIYEDCPLKYERGYLFLEHLNRSRHLLKDRPITLQHGDYHVGNMICSRSGHVGIIDFNRFDFGDPWEEFNRIVWDIQCSPYFAAGRIDGYFNGQVPEAFFALLTVYIASNTLSSLPWAMDFGDQEIEIMRNQAKEILDTYDDFSRVVPKWYLEVKDKMSL